MKPSLDPRTKLFLTICYAALVISSHVATWLLGELAVLLILVQMLGEGRAYLRWLRVAAMMTLTWFLISWFAFDLSTGLVAAMRLLALMSVFFLFFRTTAPEDLGNALVKVGLPFEVAFVFSAAMQFVPVIGRKAQDVFDAQRSRGIPLEPGVAALRHYPALMVPLLVQAFQLADDLAEAMEVRGFGRSGRTFLREYRMRAIDWGVVAGGLLALVGIIFIR